MLERFGTFVFYHEVTLSSIEKPLFHDFAFCSLKNISPHFVKLCQICSQRLYDVIKCRLLVVKLLHSGRDSNIRATP